MNKKAMEMVIGTVIIIVIALAVLVTVLYAFYRTEGNFRQAIDNFFKKSNVDDIVDQCNRLADLESEYEYCCVDKEIRLDGEEMEMSCLEASQESWGSEIGEVDCEGGC